MNDQPNKPVRIPAMSPPDPNSDPPEDRLKRFYADSADGYFGGVLFLFFGHVILGFCTGGAAMFFIGAAQLLYGVPIYIYNRSRGRRKACIGLVIAMVLAALLNGGCMLAFSGYGQY